MIEGLCAHSIVGIEFMRNRGTRLDFFAKSFIVNQGHQTRSVSINLEEADLSEV